MPRDKQKWTMGTYSPTQEEQDALLWCINNYIKVSPYQAGAKSWYLEVQIGGGKVHRSPNTFGPGEVWEVLYSYYLHYKNKKQ